MDHFAAPAGTNSVVLRAAGVALMLDVSPGRLPSVLHWGPDVGELTGAELAALRDMSTPVRASHSIDEPQPVTVLPEHATGWMGLPGLSGSRAGADWSPRFTIARLVCDPSSLASRSTDAIGAPLISDEMPDSSALSRAGRVTVDARDDAAALALRLEIELTHHGLVRLRAGVRNDHRDLPYTVDGLMLALPVPNVAQELLDLAGRHLRERSPQRQPFNVGARVRESRRGRPGHDATLLLVAGEPGFGFRSGAVWGVHVGWSGNHRTYAERLSSGAAVLGGGELLLPGEIQLAPGEEYTGPWLYASYGNGLDELSARFHDYLRDDPARTELRRPVVLNTWEAVYFKHDLDVLHRLADAAAKVGAERFVLDDGWFRGRRDDRAGLGDWYVDERVWPNGLHPLVDHVRHHGMEFGLWVEPEMINPSSDLARANPDWILATGHRRPPEARGQQVLDLTIPAAFDHILTRLDALLTEYEIRYLKWDHNRDLIDAGHGPTGKPGVHAQTHALYRLIDELRRRHPNVEIESCAGGGGRVDLGILARTDRIWTSDCIDALERQQIQRWTALLVPPELMGSHVGHRTSHTTGRSHTLSFRAGTALFGSFGMEWDLTTASPGELDELSQWIALYKELRPLLHAGTVVRADSPDPALWVHGVVAADRTDAVFAIVQLATGVCAPPGQVRLPGLDASRRYRVTPLPPGDTCVEPARWAKAGGLTVPGSVLAATGVQAPVLQPEQLYLLRVTATAPSARQPG